MYGGIYCAKRKLQLLTEQLIKYTDQADDIYEGVRLEAKGKGIFFSEVKPFADQVRTVCIEWETGMKEWMKETEFRHLFPEQIEQTAHNLF